MKLSVIDVENALRKLTLRYGIFFDEKRLLEQSHAYLDLLEYVKRDVFLKAAKEFDGEKFPTAFQILNQCKIIENMAKQAFFKMEERKDLATREQFLEHARKLKEEMGWNIKIDGI